MMPRPTYFTLLRHIPPWWWPLAMLAILCALVGFCIAAIAVRLLVFGDDVMCRLAGAERDR